MPVHDLSSALDKRRMRLTVGIMPFANIGGDVLMLVLVDCVSASGVASILPAKMWSFGFCRHAEAPVRAKATSTLTEALKMRTRFKARLPTKPIHGVVLLTVLTMLLIMMTSANFALPIARLVQKCVL